MCMKEIELIARIIFKREDQILLCKNVNYEHYFLPGGHVEFGDSLEETIYKEMQEELGLSEDAISNVSFKDYLEHTYGEGDSFRHELNMIFTAELDKDAKTQSQEDHIDFAWVSLSDIANIKLLPTEIIPYI